MIRSLCLESGGKSEVHSVPNYSRNRAPRILGGSHHSNTSACLYHETQVAGS